MTEKTWQEKQEENRRVYEAAKKIISSWPAWKRAIANAEVAAEELRDEELDDSSEDTTDTCCH